MRDSLLKIYVDGENFSIANTYPCREITYLAKSDHLAITPFDFILIVDIHGMRGDKTGELCGAAVEGGSGQVLRNCCEIIGKTLSYTSAAFPDPVEDLALQAVIANLYDGIQCIRHGAPTDRTRFWEKFPFEKIERELWVIKLCVALLEGNLEVSVFQTEMEKWSRQDDQYYLVSTNAILDEYPWKFRAGGMGRAALGRIRSAVEEMEKSMEGGKGLERIWKLAYDVHNEPRKILVHGMEAMTES